MTGLQPIDLDRLKLLLAGKSLPMEAKVSILNILRSGIPDLFSGLTEKQLKDIDFLTKYLSDPFRKKKVKEVLRRELYPSLSSTQQLDLEQAQGEVSTTAEEAGGQPTSQELPPATGQEVQPTETAGGSTGGMPSGLSSSSSFTPRHVFIARQTPPPKGGMAGGTGEGTTATNKIDRLEAERAGAATAESNRISAQSTTLQAKAQSTPLNKSKPAEVSNLRSTTPQRFNFPALRSRAGSAAKNFQNFSSPAGPFVKTNLNRIGGSLKNMFGGMANLGGKAGLEAVNHGGNFLSSAKPRFTGRFGRNGGGRGLFGRFSSGGGGKNSLAANRSKLAIFGMIGFMALVGMITMTAPSATPGQAAPLPTTKPTSAPSTDLSSCKFTRAGVGTQFQSPLLLSFIQEAAQKANIPPVILAAFLRVESPASSNMPDAEVTNYSAKCAQSSTGALGIMQIQPPGTTSARGDPASCDDCIDAGAKLVGKTVSTMTRQDYCDPKTSIIVGAGWILKKMSMLGYGDGTKWDPAWTNDRKAIETLVNTYYGCLIYGDPIVECTGPYNYADDVSASIKNCQTTPVKCSAPGGSCPLISCPLSKDGSGSFDITCGTFKNPNSSGCGHGAPYPAYPTCSAPPYAVCPYSDQLKAAIDVRPSGQNGANAPIYLPFVNGSSVDWTLVSGPITLNGGSWGVKMEYTATTADGKQIQLDLTHLDSNIISGANKSGDQVGITKEGVDKNGGHLHTAVSLNGNWLDSIDETHICTP